MLPAFIPFSYFTGFRMLPTHGLLVERYKSTSDATLSRVYLTSPDFEGEREFLCHGLEDEYRDVKVAGETRIPAGTYDIDLRTVGGFHSRYDRRINDHIGMIWVRRVPGFKYILWHIGNFETNTDGCLLLGRGDVNAMAVWSSSATYKRVYSRLAPMIRDHQIKQVKYRDLDR